MALLSKFSLLWSLVIFLNVSSVRGESLTVGTYNLHNLENPEGLKSDLAKLEFVDVWGFQEVMFYGDEVDTDFLAAKPATLPYLKTLPIALVQPEISRWEGHAILSRYPIEDTGLIPLEANGSKPRAALYAFIRVGQTLILFVDTDHDVNFGNIGYQERQKNIQSLLKGLQQLNFPGPTILVGDFNTADSYRNWNAGLSGTDEVHLTQADFKRAGWIVPNSLESDPYTLKSFGISQWLDHIFLKGVTQADPWQRLNSRIGSDHFPIYLKLDIP